MADITGEAREQLAGYSAALVGIEAQRKESDRLYKLVRGQVFDLIDQLAGPDSKLAVEIPATGRRIGRTMVYGSPSLDADKLREVVGDEAFEKVTVKTVTYSIDYGAMRDAIRNEEITRSQVEKAVIPGTVTSRLLHSKIGGKSDDEESTPAAKSPVAELLEF